jgi:8-hydroxy-5-deazaflavin:NADPH oxidoreductase
MKIALLGTGTVGRALARGLARCGHEVVIGTREPEATAGRDLGAETFAQWLVASPGVTLAAASEAAAVGDLVVNATNGEASLTALAGAGEAALAGKVLLDVANPLDFSNGFPPTLSVCNNDSLAEQIQRAFPSVLVVKSLNTVTADVMVNPAALGAAGGAMFVAGDDATAKAVVSQLLTDLGWQSVVDLGGLAAARGMEMYLPLWLRLMQATGTAEFNIAIVRREG